MVVKSVKLIVEFAVGALIGAALLGGLVIWRLSGEPVSLAFLTPYLERALSAEDRSFSTKLDDTVLTWAGWRRALNIELRGVRAIGPDGSVMAAVPQMSVSLSLRALLLHGMVAPTELEILAPRLRLARGPDGAFRLGLEGAGDAAHGIMALLVRDLLAPPNPERLIGYLRAVRITDADLVLVDEKEGNTWHAPDADLELLRDWRGIRGGLSLAVDLQGRTADLEADLAYDRDGRMIDVGLSFDSFEPAKLGAKRPLIPAIEGIAVPLSGTVTASIDIDGKVEALGFDIAGEGGKLALPGLYERPLQVKTVALRGRAEDDLKQWIVDEFAADLGGPSVALSGRAIRVGESLSIQGEAAARNVATDSLSLYWPPGVARNAREWILEHISKGGVPEAHVVFALRLPNGKTEAAEVQSLAGTFRAEGVSVEYLPPMPRIDNASGRATFDHQQMAIDFTGGEVRGVRVKEGRMVMTGLDLKDQDAVIDVVVQGPLAGILEVLDHEPLEAGKFMGISPADVSGEAAARANFRFPLEKDLEIEEVKLAAAANLRGVGIKNAALGQDLTDGSFTIKADKEGLRLEGTMKLGGIPASLASTQAFAQSAPVRSRYAVSARPTEADLARIGLPVAPYLTGTMPLNLSYVVAGDGRGELSVVADLGQAAIEIAELDWGKPKGAPGTGRFALTIENDRPTQLRDFALEAGGLLAQGTGAFAPPKEPGGKAFLQRVDFARLAFGRTDVAGRVVLRADGGFDGQFRGPQIDGAKHLAFKEELRKPEEKKKSPPFTLAAAADILWVAPERKVRNASILIEREPERLRALDLQGAIEGAKDEGAFRIRVAPVQGAREVAVSAADAGEFLRSFGLFDTMQGGRLTLSGRIDDTAEGEPFSGQLLIKDYRLIKAPALARLLTAASLTGIVNVLSGEGIGFTDLKAALDLRGDVLTVKEARAYGPDIGLTMKGTINLRTETADLQGTLVPAYALNTLLGKIPLVGELLTGGEGSGVFAATYTLRGPLDDPQVGLNPLAALTPGVLRGLFEVFEKPPPAAQEAAPPAEPEPSERPAERTPAAPQ